MISATISPGVIAVPDEGADTAKIRQYITSLTAIKKVIYHNCINTYIGKDTCRRLCETGKYPDFKTLKAALKSHEIPVDMLFQVIQYILNRSGCFEDEFRIKYIMAEDNKIEPDILNDTTQEKLAGELLQLMIQTALLKHCGIKEILDNSILLEYPVDENKVNITAIIQEIESDREDLNLTLPMSIKQNLDVCCDIKELLLNIDATEYLDGQYNEKALKTALEVKLYQWRSEHGVQSGSPRLPENIIHRIFNKSFIRYFQSGHNPETLLLAMVKAVEKTRSGVHPLRKSKKNPKQRIRVTDGAKAQRRDVDSDSHLHYWECDDGSVEISYVSLTHDDFTIHA